MSRTREALVGIVIVGALLVTTIGTLWLQGTSFGGDQRDLDAVFYSVGQINPGNGVKFRGVQVGRVGEIALGPDGGLVRVTLRLQRPVTMPDDAVIILSPESMFGDWQAEIRPRSDFPYVEYPDPSDPDLLPGHALPDISQLTATADQISQDIATLTDRFGIAFSEETARDIASLIDNVENVTTELSELVAQQAQSFTEVTDGVQQATDEIASAADQTRSTFELVSNLLGQEEITTTIQDLAEISQNLRTLSAELGGTNQEIREMTARVDSTFSRVQTIVAGVEAGEGTLGRLLHDPGMANEVEGTLNELRALLEDIQENPRRYVRLSIF